MAGGESVTFNEKINWNLTPISEKCVPMAGGESVTFNEKINWNLTQISRPGDHFLNELESDPNFSKQGFLSVL